MPQKTGKLFLTPKLTPDVITKMLFGPGVAEDATVNNTSEYMYSITSSMFEN
jgi:hypothetical protein